MKITFVYPDVLLHRPDWTGYYYHGIGLLSAVLKQAGHRTSLIHVTKPVNRPDFIESVRSEDPDLIAFSSTSHMFTVTKKLAAWLLEAENRVPVICGGIHPTIAPEEAINAEGIDIICRGEGESPLLELCRKMEAGDDIGGIPNLWVRNNGDVARNPLRPLLDNLDDLPLPDRAIFAYPTLYSEREGRGSFLVGRGCMYKCTYCCNHLLMKIYGIEGKPIRFRSVDNVIGEIRQVLRDYSFIKTLIFDDDILFLKRDWSETFTEKYSKEIGLPFACNARANMVNGNLVDLLERAGCNHVKFGVESGNEEISNKVLNRRLKNEHIKRAFSLCKRAGFQTTSFNMVGIPGETPSTILDTVKLNAAIDPDAMQVTIYQPYPGTRLAEVCKEKCSHGTSDLPTDFFTPSFLKLDTISSSQVLMFRDYFRLMVRYYQVLQKLPSGMSKCLIRISDRIFRGKTVSILLNAIYVPLNYVYRRLPVIRDKVGDIFAK